MALEQKFNVDPYYDDFDESKNFYRTLFKPGFAVQARELTQIQTYLQNQIGRFGNNIFKNGSLVSGGQFFLQTATYLKIDPTVNASGILYTVDANNFTNSLLYANSTYDYVNNVPSETTKTARVVKVYAADPISNGNPITLLVKDLNGNSSFSAGETIRTSSISNTYFANVSSSANSVGGGLLFSVDEGVFFYDGYFIRNNPQTIAVSKYSYNDANASARVGFEIVESTVTSSSDTTLLDPALNASNYQAPGADRYKIDLVLSTRPLESTDDTKFIELTRIINGDIQSSTKFPEYSILEDTLARRTYDESGNYLVKPFQITLSTSAANSAQSYVTLSPGKAYVYGYEFETIQPTILFVDKPRDFSNVSNKYVSADYGNYLYITNNHGSWPIDKLSTIDLHCVNHDSMNLSSVATISNTKIGTTRIKSIEYDDSNGDSSSFPNLVYRAYLFDTNIGSITGNCVSASGNTVNIGNYFAGVPNAYVGAKFRISTGPGSNEVSKTIISSNNITFNITLSSAFVTTPNSNSVFSIDFEKKDIKSLMTGLTSANNYADVDSGSIDVTGSTIIFDTSLEPLIFKLGESYIKQGSIIDMSYYYKKLYENVTFSGNAASLTIPGGHQLSGAATTPEKMQNFMITVTSKGSSVYNVGDVITSDKWSLSGSTITVTNGYNMSANVIAALIDPIANSDAIRTKTYISANTTFPNRAYAIDVFGNSAVNVYTSNGVTEISSSYISGSPDEPQSLFVSDVYKVIKILDFNNKLPSVANVSSALDVTNNYIFDNGQRDSFYDHASLKLKNVALKPTGPLVVYYDRFESSAHGFFTVDSYPSANVSYGDIPTYTSLNNNMTYNLRDCLDFRFVRKNADATVGSLTVFDTSPYGLLPVVSSDLILDYSYYLPRIDKVVLDKNKYFRIIKGTSSLTPVAPKDIDTGITLYVLSYPAYTADVSEVNIQFVPYKRYTMRDIGTIEQRVQNLEYYTSLSLLEQDTLNKLDMTILDVNNLARFKNGIVADGFKGFSVADVENEDFKASIDRTNRMMRPKFENVHLGLKFDAANSSNFIRSGSVVTIDFTSQLFIQQKKATQAINVNPFNVVLFDGQITLSPQSDTWVDTTVMPDKISNDPTNELAVWNKVNKGYTEEWGNWITYWTGNETIDYGNVAPGELKTSVITSEKQSRTGTGIWYTPSTILNDMGNRVIDVSIVPYMRHVSVVYSGSNFKPNVKLYSFFDNILVDDFCGNSNKFVLRQKNNKFLKLPDQYYIDIVDGDKNTVNGVARVIQTSNNIVYVDTIETISNWSTSTNVYLRSSARNSNTIGTYESFSYNVSSYEHKTGVALDGTSTSILLDASSRGFANTNFDNQKVCIIAGTGYGQVNTTLNTNAFDTITGNLQISGTWTTVPDSTSIYSIGEINVPDIYGNLSGKFEIPEKLFKTGEKRFTLVDNFINDAGIAFSSGGVTFVAQGVSKSVQKEIVSTMVAVKNTKALEQKQTIVTNVANTYQTYPPIEPPVVEPPDVVIPDVEPPKPRVWPPTDVVKIFDMGRYPYTDNFRERTEFPANAVYVDTAYGKVLVIPNTPGSCILRDPLAQTFAIDPTVYPQGVYLNKLRVCFKTKDNRLPITLQIRPTVNGYPDSVNIYPYSQVTLLPEQVNVTNLPDITDSSKYTEFVFPSPVYLQPGEHSFVLLSDTDQYTVYVAEVGKSDLLTGGLISEQSYGGSLFKSQNARTWTAEQNLDMMFEIYRCNFNSANSVIQFTVDAPSTDLLYDAVSLVSSEIQLPKTVVQYDFKSQKVGPIKYQSTDWIPIITSTTYEMDDKLGPRIIQSSTNTSFILKATLQTGSSTVSPAIDVEHFGAHFIKNKINVLELSNADIHIANTGSGYTSSFAVTFEGGGGTGAAGIAEVSGGLISNVYLTANGSGYTSTPTINLSLGDFQSPTYSGSLTYASGEDKSTGGIAEHRYIIKPVTLADGFDSGDLRVYLSAYKPTTGNIYVYYKLLSAADTDSWNNKKWQLMTQIGASSFSSINKDDYRELVFAPGTNGVASNSVHYDSYYNFKTFAIKVVTTATDSTDVVKLKDFRVIALPAA